jgi:hypothetical protein
MKPLKAVAAVCCGIILILAEIGENILAALEDFPLL